MHTKKPHFWSWLIQRVCRVETKPELAYSKLLLTDPGRRCKQNKPESAQVDVALLQSS